MSLNCEPRSSSDNVFATLSTGSSSSGSSRSSSTERHSYPVHARTRSASSHRRNVHSAPAALTPVCASDEPSNHSSSASSVDDNLSDSTLTGEPTLRDAYERQGLNPRPQPKAIKDTAVDGSNKVKANNGCLGNVELDFTYANTYMSGSRHGRKTIGTGIGAPGACDLMWRSQVLTPTVRNEVLRNIYYDIATLLLHSLEKAYLGHSCLALTTILSCPVPSHLAFQQTVSLSQHYYYLHITVLRLRLPDSSNQRPSICQLLWYPFTNIVKEQRFLEQPLTKVDILASNIWQIDRAFGIGNGWRLDLESAFSDIFIMIGSRSSMMSWNVTYAISISLSHPPNHSPCF